MSSKRPSRSRKQRSLFTSCTRMSVGATGASKLFQSPRKASTAAKHSRKSGVVSATITSPNFPVSKVVSSSTRADLLAVRVVSRASLSHDWNVILLYREQDQGWRSAHGPPCTRALRQQRIRSRATVGAGEWELSLAQWPMKVIGSE